MNGDGGPLEQSRMQEHHQSQKHAEHGCYTPGSSADSGACAAAATLFVGADLRRLPKMTF